MYFEKETRWPPDEVTPSQYSSIACFRGYCDDISSGINLQISKSANLQVIQCTRNEAIDLRGENNYIAPIRTLIYTVSYEDVLL